MCEHAGWRSKACSLQNGRPEQGVKVHDVLADKMVDLGITVFAPVIVKIQAAVTITQVPEARYVADRCIQPDIEVLVVCPRNLKPKIRRVT